jgi:DNA-binding LacI/PurR family transcriptional regulator
MNSSLLDYLQLDHDSGVPLIAQLTEQLTWLIASGELSEGDLLPSMRQLAGELGVNMHTVRLAYQRLEGDGLVSVRPRLGTRVLAYDSAAVADRGADSPSYLLGVILPSPASFYTPFIQTIQEKCRDLHYLPLFCYTFENPYLVESYFNQLIARQVDGLIFASVGPTSLIEDPQLLAAYPPVVSVDVPDMPGYRVLLDNEGAAYQLTRHLLEHGYQRIGLITPPLGWPNVLAFYQGYERAILEAPLDLQMDLIIRVEDFISNSGRQGALELLDQEDPPDAILAASDSLAVGALNALQARGISVPDQIALVGYNDIPVASLVTPALTTAAVPAARMGELALDRLMTLLEGKKPPRKTITIKTELIIRRSCGCLKKPV